MLIDEHYENETVEDFGEDGVMDCLWNLMIMIYDAMEFQSFKQLDFDFQTFKRKTLILQ